MKKILWALFGNDDDPNPPAVYYPGWPEWRRRLYWWFRNPFHNLFFYVLGCADKTFERRAIYPKDSPGNLVFRPEGGWYVAVTRCRGWRLSFVSYQGPGLVKKFYIGWRERGNLGAKLTLKEN